MNLADVLLEEAVLPHLAATTKKGVLAELAAPLLALHPELDGEDVLRILYAREALGSTAVGDGVAIPHGKVAVLRVPALSVGRSVGGVDFGSPDKVPCALFFLVLTPEDGAGQHLRLLAQLARRAKDPLFRSQALLAPGRSALWQAVMAP